jgi:hypothetical protein
MFRQANAPAPRQSAHDMLSTTAVCCWCPAELTAEFMDNTLEVDDKLDSLKHVSYRWKQPSNTPL